MTTIQVKQDFSNSPLIEAMQMKKVRFALVKPAGENKYECITPYVLCRDYLKDLLYCKYVTQKSVGSVYGFDTNKYDFNAVPDDHLYLAVTGTTELIEKIKASQPKLHQIEENIKAKISEWIEYDVNASCKGLLIVADKRWMDSLLAVSYYTFLFRWFSWGNEHLSEDDKALADNAKHLMKCPSMKELNKFGYLSSKFTTGNSTDLYSLHNTAGLLYVTPHSNIEEYQVFAKA